MITSSFVTIAISILKDPVASQLFHSAWIYTKRGKINYEQRMGLHRGQTNDEDEREFTPALNILSQ